MKFVFHIKLNPLWREKIDGLRKEFPQVDFVTEKEEAEREIQEADAIVSGGIAADVLARAEKVKMIFVPFAGIDALPWDAIRQRGIRISNAHGNARYVAERCIALTLCFFGRVNDYHNDLKAFQWHGYWAKGTVDDGWESIQGRTCAVIGTGAIGKHIAAYLKAFSCRVVGFKRRPVDSVPANFDEITTDLKAALEKSELIFVALPLTDETRGLFNLEMLMEMHGKFLVNVGRGPVVDEEGLYRALKEGVLAGAGIDAWYTYPEKGKTTGPPSRFPIQELPNVVLSPHLAGFTPQALKLNIKQTAENIRAYIQTGKATFEIDPDLMY